MYRWGSEWWNKMKDVIAELKNSVKDAKGVVFDLDNTLVNTNYSYICDVVKRTLNELNMNFSEEFAEGFWYGSDRSAFIEANLKIDPKRFWVAFYKQDNIRERMKHTTVFDDIDFVDDLRKAGYKTGIVTSSPSRVGSKELELIGKWKFNSIVYANVEDGVKPKPHPEGLERCLKEMGCEGPKVIGIGDGPADIKMYKTVGVIPILVDRKTHNLTCNAEAKIIVSGLLSVGYLLGLEGY
jgi:HAD superfamily hydrolase (TIGR01549 family)